MPHGKRVLSLRIPSGNPPFQKKNDQINNVGRQPEESSSPKDICYESAIIGERKSSS